MLLKRLTVAYRFALSFYQTVGSLLAISARTMDESETNVYVHTALILSRNHFIQ